MQFTDRLKHAWNAFTNRDPTENFRDTGYSSSYRPDRHRLSRGNERSIATSVFNRISMDAASVDVKHVKLDNNGKFLSNYDSGLNDCLTLNANLDQTGRAFMQDVVLSMLDEGCVAIVPVDTDINPNDNTTVSINSLRVGKIKEWYPAHVLVELYNEQTGINKDVKLAKSTVAIIENPLYAVINEPNSTLQRLVRKLVMLDAVDNQSASGKLDMIIKLPYIIKTEARRREAEKRRRDLEDQLSGTKYGIGYIDGTENITQLNRPIENNLMKQIEYLTSMLYSQLGITTSVLDGTADEKTMLNYMNRTVEPILAAICDEMTRKFLSKTARTQGQSISFFRDPFKLLPINDIAEIADKFTRNEILSANDIRRVIGMEPSDDPKADQLYNSNIKGNTPMSSSQTDPSQIQQPNPGIQNGGIDLDAERDKIFNEVLYSLSKDVDSIIQDNTGGDSSGS